MWYSPVATRKTQVRAVHGAAAGVRRCRCTSAINVMSMRRWDVCTMHCNGR